MGLRLTLTDNELPASPAFIEFLHTMLTGGEAYVGGWYSQEDEELISDPNRFENIEEKARYVMSSREGKERVTRAYRFFKEMLTGQLDTLKSISRFRFFFVIGAPRTGGTYLTKQIFRAAGIDYSRVQNALAHDGFPHLAVLSFKEVGNVHTNGLLQLAEYLTMVEMFFAQHGKLAYHGGVVVPKKFTKAIYNFALIKELFGSESSYIITLRHPLSIIQSTLDKSGGMPPDGRFAVRSAIERWALDDWVRWGLPEEEIAKMQYLDVFLGYWKRYHFQLALEGIPAMKTATVVPYGDASINDAVNKLYDEFGVDIAPEDFKAAKPPRFKKQEKAAAELVVKDVADFWDSLGLKFPVEQLSSMD